MSSKQDDIKAFIATDEGKDMLLSRGGISRVARHCGVSRPFASYIVNGKTRRTEGRPAPPGTPAISSLAAERERLEVELRGHIDGIAATLWKLGELGAIEEVQRRVLDLGRQLLAARLAIVQARGVRRRLRPHARGATRPEAPQRRSPFARSGARVRPIPRPRLGLRWSARTRKKGSQRHLHPRLSTPPRYRSSPMRSPERAATAPTGRAPARG